MKRNSVCASSFFCIPSVKALHCIGVLTKALKFAVFWSSRKLTSLRGACTSALPPLTIFHSLSALQLGLHCTQSGHQQQASRSRYIPAQHRCARMTRPPALPPCLLHASARPNKFCSCSCRRCCFLMMRRSLSSTVGSGRASVEATGPVSVLYSIYWHSV